MQATFLELARVAETSKCHRVSITSAAHSENHQHTIDSASSSLIGLPKKALR
ncbi:hypothetical protein BH10BAC4_BH10BAC4_23930 [soil metagenome]